MACPVCESNEIIDTFDLQEMMFRVGKHFTYAQCGECDSLYIGDVPSDLGSFYPASYYSVNSDPRVIFSGRVQKAMASLLAKCAIRQWTIPLRLFRILSPLRELRTFATSLLSYASAGLQFRSALDIGSGNGAVAYALSLGGLAKSDGIDPFCSQEISDGSFQLMKSDVHRVHGSWDLVTFHHSLEHVPDPREQLISASKLLSEHGRIIVRIPTITSNAWVKYRAAWFQLDPPRHLFIPSRKGLSVLADKAGLVVERSYDDSSSAQYWMSDLMIQGKAMTLGDMSPGKFQLAPRNPILLFRYALQTARNNRKSEGDQVCYVLARRCEV